MDRNLKNAKLLRIFNLLLLITSGIILYFFPCIMGLGAVIIMAAFYIGSCLEVFDLNILEETSKKNKIQIPLDKEQ